MEVVDGARQNSSQRQESRQESRPRVRRFSLHGYFATKKSTMLPDDAAVPQQAYPPMSDRRTGTPRSETIPEEGRPRVQWPPPLASERGSLESLCSDSGDRITSASSAASGRSTNRERSYKSFGEALELGRLRGQFLSV